MTIRRKIANWLTGGELDRINVERDNAVSSADMFERLYKKSQETINTQGNHYNGVMMENAKTIKAQRLALDQIAAELTDLIDMPQHRRTTTAIRAIRALTKGPHK